MKPLLRAGCEQSTVGSWGVRLREDRDELIATLDLLRQGLQQPKDRCYKGPELGEEGTSDWKREGQRAGSWKALLFSVFSFLLVLSPLLVQERN